MPEALGYALIGAGAFGTFCMKQYRQLDALMPVAVCDTDVAAARKTADEFGINVYEQIDRVLADDAIDLIHLATPPSTHADIALKALRAGKHVLCEKPLAVEIDDGMRLLDAAAEADRLLAVNLVMRYDPINQIVRRIIDEKLLGEVIAGSLMNLASDHKLMPDHWFWDLKQSGGIFIEHGVHFFDLFEMWLGPATVRSAQESFRPGSDDKVIEQVRCVTEHGRGILIDHYHGFHQAEPMDRQELRLICERGDLLLRGWLSESIEIDALLEDTELKKILLAMNDLQISVSSELTEASPFKARHKTFSADTRSRITGKLPYDKPHLYGQCIRDLMADQIAWIHDHTHDRRITEANGLRSLEVAHQASKLAAAAEEMVA